jgi:hypothetical protein
LTSCVTFVTDWEEGGLMTTERLIVLVGAAALGEFTAPELAAYTGANSNTVRQVLQREQKRHGFFERVDAASKPSSGRPAALWRLSEDHRAQILGEIASEEAKLAELRGTVDDGRAARTSPTDRSERAAMFVASAEETLARSYDTADPREREALAAIALNLLRAANPGEPEGDQVTGAEWWERERHQLRGEFTASLDTISRVSIESHLRAVQLSRQVLEQEDLLRRRAHRVAAFAALSARQAEGLPIGPEALMDAAESISAGSGILPVPQTLGWIKVFVDISIASGNPAPVAILAKSEQSPDEFFPVSRGAWSKVRPPAELAGRGYSLWVESWAEVLLAYSLIPGIVVAHDDSPESNDTLTQVMRETEHYELGRAVVVVSTTDDFQVVARVSEGGGIFYPLRRTVEGLQTTVNRAVVQAVSATPDLAISYWMASGIYRVGPDIVSMPVLDILRAVSGVVVRPSDLELAQRTLAVLDDAVREFDTVQPEVENRFADLEQAVMYMDFVRRVADRLSELGGSRHALSVAETALSNYSKIIQFKSFPFPSGKRIELTRRRLAEIEQRREVTVDMAWAYESLSATADKTDADEAASQAAPELEG